MSIVGSIGEQTPLLGRSPSMRNQVLDTYGAVIAARNENGNSGGQSNNHNHNDEQLVDVTVLNPDEGRS